MLNHSNKIFPNNKKESPKGGSFFMRSLGLKTLSLQKFTLR
ncbi:hypothetical protein BPO_0321 [Bergeyella porcorum]|uniref:Uncharacterized protein n=1 Tax=Bergeyella porcorum TaxID=1735111 RepID=A0AAU0F0N7_9FLAO